MITPYLSLEHKRYNVIILAGGKGTRLKEQSTYIPKAMSSLGESVAINIIIEQFQNIAHKYVIGTATHAHLLEAHVKGCYPQYPIVFSRESELINNAYSFLLALDNADSRYGTILVFCDALCLGNPIIKDDSLYIVNDNTQGWPSTYRAGFEYGNIVEYEEAKTTGIYPQWVFSNTVLLKKIVYGNSNAQDLIKYVKEYHNTNHMKTVEVKLAVEFGTEADLHQARRIWQTI